MSRSSLPRAQCREPGCLLFHEEGPELVDVGEAVLRVLLVRAPVVRISGIGPRYAVGIVGQHEWPGADHVPPIRIVAVLLDYLPRQYPVVRFIEDCAQCAERRLLQFHDNRILVGGLDRFPWQVDQHPALLGAVGEFTQGEIALIGKSDWTHPDGYSPDGRRFDSGPAARRRARDRPCRDRRLEQTMPGAGVFITYGYPRAGAPAASWRPVACTGTRCSQRR